ncbi:hypothetical protein C8Q80DRAFT_1264534 [Daedaleopsis nitida]|nr:hypothetical protein C8Q80DRAFT_1264534 [Daedaleopsis nitida]
MPAPRKHTLRTYVARGHKAAINNPNVSEEAKDRSRRKLEELEGTADTEAFTASTGTKKSDNYDSGAAIDNVDADGERNIIEGI